MKIAVCVPVYRDCRAGFTQSLARMVARTAPANFNYNGAVTRPEIEIFFKPGSMIAHSRNWLAGQALQWGAHYILWADDDHSFPPETLIRLLRHNLAMVGINALRRGTSQALSTSSREGDLVMTTKDKAEAGLVEEVDSLGLGLCLMNAAVIRDLEAPLFDTDLASMIGEDVFLCRRLRAAGVKIHVDHALSWESRHFDTVGLGFHLLGETANAGAVLPATGDQ